MPRITLALSLCYILTLLTQAAEKYDVVVYGGTPGGITAAIAAAREGKSVVLLEQTKHVGGLFTSGLNRDESEHMDRRTFGGLCNQFTDQAATRSGQKFREFGPRVWQSRYAEEVYLEMLSEHKVPVRYDQLIEGAVLENKHISKITVQGEQAYAGKVFIDATYEGDLMAAAGISYTVGREAKDTYNEPLAGVRYLDEKIKASPYDADGKLLPGIMPGKPPEEFSESPHPISYNVRLNLTLDPENQVPINKPENYNPKDYELLARSIEAESIDRIGKIIGIYDMPGKKRELNNRQFSIVSLSIPGGQTAWSEASFEDREKIHQRYRDYTHGMLWFLKSDERVPVAMRKDMARYGFCKDEWTDNNHWPWYLYIRAARRMKGPYIMTLADITTNKDKDDVIHIGSHFIDSHHVTRYAVDENHFINEGRIWQEGVNFDIPYRAITPKSMECENLLVPVCVSASNVAFCAIRLEPTWMHLGEVAGIAASMACDSGSSVQTINIKELQQRIEAAGIPLEVPEKN